MNADFFDDLLVATGKRKTSHDEVCVCVCVCVRVCDVFSIPSKPS